MLTHTIGKSQKQTYVEEFIFSFMILHKCELLHIHLFNAKKLRRLARMPAVILYASEHYGSLHTANWFRIELTSSRYTSLLACPLFIKNLCHFFLYNVQ